MIWLLALVVVVGVTFFVWKNNKKHDAVVKVTKAVEKVADVNNDGKVNLADAFAAAENIKKEVVKDVAVAKETVKKVRKKYGGKVKKTPKA
jgi:hypothetical protein